jgi:hypothetical protein
MKTMFSGVVIRPNEQHNFGDKIYLKRISRQYIHERVSYHHNCHIDTLNTDGAWRAQYTDDGMSFYEIWSVIQERYL